MLARFYLVDTTTASRFIPAQLDLTAVAGQHIFVPFVRNPGRTFEDAVRAWLKANSAAHLARRGWPWQIVTNSATAGQVVNNLYRDLFDVELMRTINTGVEESFIELCPTRTVCSYCPVPKVLPHRGDFEHHLDRHHRCVECGECNFAVARRASSGALLCTG